MSKVIKLTINDGLGFPSGFVAPSSFTCIIYSKVPENYVLDDKLKKGCEEILLENMYGKNWRLGNEDGSFYVIRSLKIQVLNQQQVDGLIWLSGKDDPKDSRYWYYNVTESMEVEVLGPLDLVMALRI